MADVLPTGGEPAPGIAASADPNASNSPSIWLYGLSLPERALRAGLGVVGGVLIILTGVDDLGRVVRLTTRTRADGFYSFGNLRPGVYAIREIQPRGFKQGKNRIGSQGGRTAKDLFWDIRLIAGMNGVNNNFGERVMISKRSFLGSAR